MSKLTAPLFWKVFFLVLIVFSWYQYSVIQRLRFGQMGHLPHWLIGGNFGGETFGNFGGDYFNRNNHWRHGLVMLLFVMLIIKLIKCIIVWQILAVDNVGMSVAIWFLSKNFAAEGTYFVVISSVHFHFQVSAHFQVFYNVVFVFGFHNTAICWTVENIAKEWNLVFIVRMRSMIFQSFMFISITFGTEWLFTILITTSKNHPDKQSPQLVHIFCMIFPYKCFLFNTLSKGKVSMPHLFSFPRCVIKFLFRQLMMSQTIGFILDQPLKQWLTGRKRGKDGNTEIWISRERKELFRWNKKHFSYFFGGLSFG